jgi:hypothetical protein
MRTHVRVIVFVSSASLFLGNCDVHSLLRDCYCMQCIVIRQLRCVLTRAIVFVCRCNFVPRQLNAHSFSRDCYCMQCIVIRQLRCVLTLARLFLYAGAALCLGNCMHTHFRAIVLVCRCSFMPRRLNAHSSL